MTRPYAVAGADIEPGMTIQLAPDEAPFVVAKVEPYPQADSWLWAFNEQGRVRPVQKAVWYADLSDTAEFPPQVMGGESDASLLGLVTSEAPAGEGSSSDSPCSQCGVVDGHTGQCAVIS